MGELTPLIMDCIVFNDTTAEIKKCVEDSVQAGSDCGGCICEVMEVLGYPC